MKENLIIDSTFNLKKALEVDGFSVDEHDSESIAKKIFLNSYGEVYVAFKFSFGTGHTLPIDMLVYKYDSGFNPEQEILFKGLAPTNQKDYDTLMQLLFPTKEFVQCVEASMALQDLPSDKA
jgi:hypothetical protein